MNNYELQVTQEDALLQKYINDKKLTTNDLKIFKLILAKVKCNDFSCQNKYEIDYRTLEMAEVSCCNRYKEVERSLIKFMNTIITIKKEDRERLNDLTLKKAKGERKLGLIVNDWIHEEKSSKIVITIPKILKPFFLEFANKEHIINYLEDLNIQST